MASVRAKKRSRSGIFRGLTKISNYVKATPESTADDSPPRTHIPVDGSVDLPLDNPVATLGPGELLGELTALAALKQDRVKRAKFYPRSATVQAKTDVEVLEILPHILNNVLLGYLLDSGDPYILWSTEAAFSVPPMMDLYGTGSMATACCTSR